MEFNMIIAGFGGQGVLFTGKVAAYCGLLDGLEVSWLPSYGPEMRGGTTNCSVCFSGQPIGSPLVTRADLLIAMNTPSYEKFLPSVKPGGMAVIDSTLVKSSKTRDDIKLFTAPSTELSDTEHLEGIANMILLGKALREAAFASLETAEKAIAKCVSAQKAHLLEHNIRAVKLGMTL